MMALYLGDSKKLKMYFSDVVYNVNLPPRTPMMRYVSMGDSIAAGHTINADWTANYGEGSQYGVNGNTSTAIVPGCYTDLIRSEMENIYGSDKVSAISFARSGNTVADLMEKLSHIAVRNAISQANIVTICIGANDVLQPAMFYLADYINGDYNNMLSAIKNNLDRLNNDNDPNSYWALLNKLYSINANAQYIFTTIYNPYKYLWLEKSSAANDYKDGFLGPLMWAIPDSMGETVANTFRAAFLKAPAVENLFDKINQMPLLAESFVTGINNALTVKVEAFGKPNFIVADTKTAFETVPDRNVAYHKHYNDLVSVEFTKGYTVENVNWGEFWDNIDWGSALSNIDQIANIVINTIVDNVIVPDVDPHPEWYGHHVLYSVFMDALGFEMLPKRTISLNPNGANGYMNTINIPIIDGNAPYAYIPGNTFTHLTQGTRFDGWNTNSDGTGTLYSAGQFISLAENLTLYAQWSTKYVINIHHSYDSILHGSGDTGPMECYALWIDGVEQPDLGAFSNGSRVLQLEYGSKIGVIAQTKTGSDRSYITLNGQKIAGNSNDARYTFTVTSHMDIHFEWNYWLDGISPQSYWNCYVSTY